jgi:SAM-dependent methyltransferase
MVVHCAHLLRERLGPSRTCAGLVVGCGSGDEVVYIRHALNSRRVLGIDVQAEFSHAARCESCVFVADAEHLPWPSEVFDFVASFHSLEHMGNAGAALDEIRRVLRGGGWFYVGVPNKSRLFGYLGSFDATAWQKITWNAIDWWARLRGRFENASGAHAGFDKHELLLMLGQRFAKVDVVTEEFVRFKYNGRLPKTILDVLLAARVVNYSVPAHYALCQRQ